MNLDLALANAAITYFAVRGERGWEQAYDVRAVMTLAPNVALFVAKKGSGVERIADLAGRRVSVGPAGAGFEMFVGPLLEAHGLTESHIELPEASLHKVVAVKPCSAATARIVSCSA